jgi:hypothetical protein
MEQTSFYHFNEETWNAEPTRILYRCAHGKGRVVGVVESRGRSSLRVMRDGDVGPDASAGADGTRSFGFCDGQGAGACREADRRLHADLELFWGG